MDRVSARQAIQRIWDQLSQDERTQLVFYEGVHIDQIMAVLNGLEIEHRLFREALEHARDTLLALDRRGGLGHDKHMWIRSSLDEIAKAIVVDGIAPKDVV